MSQVSKSMALPSKPAPEYRQDPERVKHLLECFKLGKKVSEPRFDVRDLSRRVTGYANVGALYEFSFSDQTRELLDGTAPDDAVEIVRECRPTRAEHAVAIAELKIAIQERDLARAKMIDEYDLAAKDIAMWKDEAEKQNRTARRWAFYSPSIAAGGIGIGYALARLA